MDFGSGSTIIIPLSLDELRAIKKPDDLKPFSSVLLKELPPAGDSDVGDVLKRLMDRGIKVLTPLSEQLLKPLPNATVLLTLSELSTGAHKRLPPGTRLVVSVQQDCPNQELQLLKETDAIDFIIDSVSNPGFIKGDSVQEGSGLAKFLSDNGVHFNVIPYLKFPENANRDHVLKAAGELLAPGLRSGILLDAPGLNTDLLEFVSIPSYYAFNRNVSQFVDYKRGLLDDMSSGENSAEGKEKVSRGVVYEF